MANEPSFTMGVEQEDWLVDKASGDFIEMRPDGLMNEMVAALGEQITKVFDVSCLCLKCLRMLFQPSQFVCKLWSHSVA